MYYSENLINKLKGQRVISVTRIKNDTFEIKTDKATVKLSVSGDCCSHSVFYDLVDIGIGGEILEIDTRRDAGFDTKNEYESTLDRETGDYKFKSADKNMEHAIQLAQDQGFGLQEFLSFWDVVITTTKGDIIIKHVNGSNGYYDGELNWNYKVNE